MRALSFLLPLFVIVSIAHAQTAETTFSWTPSVDAVKFRLYREDCKWGIAPETTEMRVVTARTCSWVMHAEADQPLFKVRPPFTRTHWMAVDVKADGTEIQQRQKGWWTQP